MTLPWYPDSQLLLHRDEPGKYSQARGSCSKHNEDPDIKLDFRPVVSSSSCAVYDFGHVSVDSPMSGVVA